MSQTRFQDKSNPDQNFAQRERNFWGFFEGYPVSYVTNLWGGGTEHGVLCF